MSSDKTSSVTKKKKKGILPPPSVINCANIGDDHTYGKVDYNKLKVRGKKYMKDSKKIEAKAPILTLEHCDLFLSKQPLNDFANHRKSYVHYLNKKGDTRFKFVLLVQMPPHHCAVTWTLDQNSFSKKLSDRKANDKTCENDNTTDNNKIDEDDDGKESDIKDNSKNNLKELLTIFKEEDEAFAKVFKKWIFGNKEQKDAILKLLPRVLNGGFFVQKTIGTGKPTLFATKMTCNYYDKINTKQNYFEIDIDTHSSEIARRVLGVVKKSATSLVLEIALILEGRDESELPERVICGICFSKLDLNKARVLKGVDPGV